MTVSECAELLLAQDKYLIITHKRPDGDTIGSASALCHALRRCGKEAFLFPNREITETYTPFAAPYLAVEGYNALRNISVDAGDAGMLATGFEGEIWLKLDHHQPRGDSMGEHALVRTSAAACGEIILDLILALCGNVEKEEADLLYMAVSTDTGCFCYANTSADTFRAAATLMEAGADLPQLNKLLFRTKRKERLLLESKVFSSLRSYKDNAINLAVVTLDMLSDAGVTEDDCDDLASLAGLVKGNRVSITVRELSKEPPKSKVSLRTDGSVDASAVCAFFSGGGHKMAAGCEMSLTPEKTAEAILSAVEKVWP